MLALTMPALAVAHSMELLPAPEAPEREPQRPDAPPVRSLALMVRRSALRMTRSDAARRSDARATLLAMLLVPLPASSASVETAPVALQRRERSAARLGPRRLKIVQLPAPGSRQASDGDSA